MNPQITVAEHAGFCFGVKRAVDAAVRELEKAKKDGVKLYCLGPLIHNKNVTQELEEKGLITIRSITSTLITFGPPAVDEEQPPTKNSMKSG